MTPGDERADRRSRGRATAGRRRRRAAPGRVGDVGDRGEQRRVDHRGPEPEQRRGDEPDGEGRARARSRRSRTAWSEHAADDERLAADPVRQPAGRDLADGPDRRVGRGEDADLGRGQAGRRVEEREQAPGHAVVEVVDEPAWRRGREGCGRGSVVRQKTSRHGRRVGPRRASRCSCSTWPRVSRTNRTDAPRPRTAIRQRRGRMAPAAGRTRPAIQPGRERREGDRAVAGGLVEAHREAAPRGTDEVDLHDHRRRPGQPLVHAEQDVGGDDPGPVRGPDDQERDGQPDQPAGDEDGLAAERDRPGAPATRLVTALVDAECDDERERRDERR